MVTEQDCLFCKIIKGDIPAKKVYEDEECLAFLDINPRNPGHTLVVPKKHVETLLEIDEETTGNLFQTVRKVAGMVKAGTKAQGLSICQSNGQAAGQIIAHLHVHIIPRFATEGPPGLESILPAKRLDEETLDKIAGAIKGSKDEPFEEVQVVDMKEKGEEAEVKEKGKEDEISFEF